MRKTRLMTLIVVAAISLATLNACGGAKKEDTKGTVSATEETEEEDTTESEAEEPAAEEEQEEEPAEETVEAATEEENAWEELEIGTTSQSTYKNEYFDIALTVNEEWAFATEEEIEETNKMVIESLSDGSANAESVKNALEKGGTYTDMIVYYMDGTINMNTTIGKISFLEQASAKRGTLIEDIISSNGKEMEELYESAYGMENVKVTAGETTFCGETTTCLVINAKTQGLPLYMKQVYIVRDGYNAIVTATSFIEDYTDDALALFTAAEADAS